MPLPQKLPDPTGWRFILVHRVVRHGSQMVVPGYEEVGKSFLSLHHGEVKPTICLRSSSLRDRALRLGGWEDITAEVGPQTPKLWDEEKGRWKLDPEGFLPWERKPGEKVAPLPVQASPEGEEEEVPLVEDPPAASTPPAVQAQPPVQEDPGNPKRGNDGKKPSTRPRA